MEKVKDYEDLVRDTSTRAIINTNSSGLRQAKLARDKLLSSNKTIEDMKSRLGQLEELVKTLVNKEL